jgi:hypothetical protein
MSLGDGHQVLLADGLAHLPCEWSVQPHTGLSFDPAGV